MERTENKEAVEPAVVSAVGLTKVFQDFWMRPKAKAVNDIDFEIRKGEVIGLLGPNGSGKSTTVKMLLGLLYPTGGRLTVFGKSPRDVEIKKRIGYLPEETYLYKYLTAFETLDFFASLFNLSKEERTKRCNQLLDMVGLSHARNRPVGEFSKGMARRIGLAQAMVNDPEFLILDEPTSGLDPLGCREVKDLIKMLKMRGKTVLVTSHLLSDVEEVCDRIIILYGGKIRAQGELNSLLTIDARDTITTPKLSQAALDQIKAIIERENGGSGVQISHPHKTLEEFFLDIVNKAKSDSLETFGAQSGGHIADYLTEGAGVAGASADQVLASLANKEAPVPQEKPVEESAEKKAEIAAAEALLDDLKQAKPAVDAVEEAKAREEQREKLAGANDKLKDLFGGK